jgi:O-antigen ligase
VVVAAGLIGAYAALRWFIGPAAAERNLAIVVDGSFNFVEGHFRDVGSFNAGHQLGFWTGATGPFCLAAALGWRGRWRLVAAAAFLLVTFAVLASEVRGGLIGLVIGVAIVLVLFQVARSVPGLRLGRSVAIAAMSVAVIGGALIATVGSTGRLDRYTNIFHPSQDPAYVSRTTKGGEALRAIEEQPWGHGLGTASQNESLRGPYLSIASKSVDNSFLKVGFEQGIPVLLLFVGALGFLLLRLSVSSVRTRDAEAAAMGIGAAGALASSVAIFYTGIYFEDLIALGPWIMVGLGAAFLIDRQPQAVETRPQESRRPTPMISSRDRSLRPPGQRSRTPASV